MQTQRPDKKNKSRMNGAGLTERRRGVDGNEPDDEHKDESADGEDGIEANAGVLAADSYNGGEDGGDTVAEGKEGDNASGGGEVKAG